MTYDWKKHTGLAAIAVFFIASALLFLPRLGIEADEAIIANGIYEHGAPVYSWHFGKSELPVMLLSYLGALKTWLYNPYFYLWAPGPVSLRVPMVLVGAATLWLFFALLDRIAGRRAAWIGTILLATDSSFLLLEATDFGFVALQFFLKLSAILLVLRFNRTQSRWALTGAFFLLGLALWDKAVFLWVLFGLAAATLVVFPREVRRVATPVNCGVALATMLLGALPLVIYNIARPLETLRANVKVERTPILAKTELLTRTLDGSVLFGFLTEFEPGPNPGRPRHWYQTLSVRIAEWTRHPRHNLTLWALLLSGLALPFLWTTPARPPMLFGLIACAATWLPMALTANAGFAAHHVILLWPFHFLVIAVALARVPLPLAAAAGAVLCLTNVALDNQYYSDLILDGPAIRWTDAIDSLSQFLKDSNAEGIFIADWGFQETLNLTSQGKMPVDFAETRDREVADRMIAGPNYIIVSHTPHYTFVPETRATLDDIARRDGYEEERLATICDRSGRPTFDVFRFRKLHL